MYANIRVNIHMSFENPANITMYKIYGQHTVPYVINEIHHQQPSVYAHDVCVAYIC